MQASRFNLQPAIGGEKLSLQITGPLPLAGEAVGICKGPIVIARFVAVRDISYKWCTIVVAQGSKLPNDYKKLNHKIEDLDFSICNTSTLISVSIKNHTMSHIRFILINVNNIVSSLYIYSYPLLFEIDNTINRPVIHR